MTPEEINKIQKDKIFKKKIGNKWFWINETIVEDWNSFIKSLDLKNLFNKLFNAKIIDINFFCEVNKNLPSLKEMIYRNFDIKCGLIMDKLSKKYF